MIIRIKDEVGLSQAILEARRQALALGFDNIEASKIGTAVSELGRNILKYAGRGSVEVKQVEKGRFLGLEVIVSDRGPGIEDLEQALSDHYSSSGTLGLGLPGVRRLMDDFHLDSTVGEGTTVTIRKFQR